MLVNAPVRGNNYKEQFLSLASSFHRNLLSFMPEGSTIELQHTVQHGVWFQDHHQDSYLTSVCMGVVSKHEMLVAKYNKYQINERPDEVRLFWRKLLERAVDASATARRAVTSLISHLIRTMAKNNIIWHSSDLSSENWVTCLSRFQQKYFFLWLLGLANKWTKFHFASLFSRSCEQELPATFCMEQPGYFLTGIGQPFLVKIMGLGYSYALPFLKAKKGMPKVHDVLLHDSTRELYKVLGTAHRPLRTRYDTEALNMDYLLLQQRVLSIRDIHDYVQSNYETRLEFLAQQVRRTCTELFSSKKGTNIEVLLPSIAAHNNFSCADGGAMAPIADLIASSLNSTKQKLCDAPKLKGAHYKSWVTVAKIEEAVETGWALLRDSSLKNEAPMDMNHPDLLDYRALWYEEDCIDNSHALIQYAVDTVKCDVLSSVYEKGIDREIVQKDCDLECSLGSVVSDECSFSSRTVDPVALPEPDKVRMITKGPVYRYWLTRGIQRFTHDVLRHHPTFRLIGEPVKAEHLNKLLPLGMGESLLSGDYKSATDLLHPDLSVEAVDAICDVMDWDYEIRQLYKLGLVGAEIKKSDGTTVKQVWGQLMGSPLSFPILCIVNAALQRSFLELSDYKVNKYKLCDCPFLVNGDDVAARICTNHYSFWKKMVDDAGLVPSVGKNYLSTDFVIINSTCYKPMFNMFVSGWMMDEVPCLNLGLLHPQRGDLDALASYDPMLSDLSSISHKLVEGHSWEERQHLLSGFLGTPYVKDVLSKVLPRVSYFASKSLGGLGIYASRPNLLTDEQLGYYTRVAGAAGADAPLFPDITLYDSKQTMALSQFVPQDTIWDDWFLETIPCSSGPSSGHYWKAMSKVCEVTGSFSDTVKSLREAKKSRIWGDRAVFTPMIVDRELFRKHAKAWPQGSLCNFPWTRQGVIVPKERIEKCSVVLC